MDSEIPAQLNNAGVASQLLNCWDAPLGWLWLHTFLAHTKGMVLDMCRQATNVILEQELQPVLNSK